MLFCCNPDFRYRFRAFHFHSESMEDSTDTVSIPRNGVVGRIDLNPPDSLIPDLTDQIHQLPCCIKHNGPCPVSDYFRPKRTGIAVDGMDVEEASFRGRKLHGATIPLPEGYCGFILEKKSLGQQSKKMKRAKSLETSEEDCNYWEAHAKFQNITYWNHYSLPSNDDAFSRLFHWFSVANALHKPVTEEDLTPRKQQN